MYTSYVYIYMCKCIVMLYCINHVCVCVWCVSSLRRGHANILCIVPMLKDDP